MGALTLIEAAKLKNGQEFERGVIELYAGSSDILRVLPFRNISGNSLAYNRQASLPGVGFRGVNEAYTPNTGVLNPLVEVLKIAGGEIDVDVFLVKTEGQEQRTIQEAGQIEALGLAWTNTFINGSSTTEVREFDGLADRIVGDQLISAGATANGAALSLDKMDEAIDQCLDPTHIIMNRAMRRKFIKAARTTTVSGNVTQDKDEMGKTIHLYNDLPILTVDLDNNQNEILGFDEAAASGTDTASSIYVVSIGPRGLTGLQNGGMEVRDLGELETQPVMRTRVEWFNGMALFNGRSAVRLQHIGDLDIVA